MSADPDLCQFYVSELWVHLLSAQLLNFDEVVGKANFTSAHLIFSAEALFVCFFLKYFITACIVLYSGGNRTKSNSTWWLKIPIYVASAARIIHLWRNDQMNKNSGF